MDDILGRIVSANQVQDNVRVPDASLDGSRVVKVVFLDGRSCSRILGKWARRTSSDMTYDKDDAAEVSRHLEMALGHLLAVGNDDGATLAGYAVIVSLPVHTYSLSFGVRCSPRRLTM